jgi:integrase
MGLYYRLDYKNNKNHLIQKDSVPVIIDYYYKGKRTKVSTGVVCQIKDWDDNWRKKTSKDPIKSSDKDYRDKNLLIKNKLDEINGIVLTIKKQDKEPLVELVRSYLRKDKRTKEVVSRKEIHFLPMLTEYEKWINSTSYNNRTSTKRSTNTSIKQIREYTSEYQTKNNVLLFPEDLDSDWVYGFCRWSYDRKGLRPSTIRKRMKALTRFSNWSNEKYGTNFSIKKPDGIVLSDGGGEVIFFKRDEVLKLYNYDKYSIQNPNHTEVLQKERRLTYIDDSWVDTENKRWSSTYTSFEVYKDMLIFLCNVGCRFGDMVKMKIGDFDYDTEEINGKRLGYFSFFMEKIKIQKEPVRVRINRMTFEIWKKYSKNKNAHNYLFPRTKFGNAISNQKYNSYIKEICKHIGLDRGVRVRDWDLNGKEENTSFIPLYSIVSSHIGRRTFIREHIELGTPIRSIMKMTGHTTQKVFDGYYNVLDKDIMKVNDGLFNQELDQKKNKKSKSITSETEEQLKTLLRLKEMGTLPEDIWKEKVKQLIS